MKNINTFRGCIFGGAAGDALGYTVEFMPKEEIIERFGESGITAYVPDPFDNTVHISDDTLLVGHVGRFSEQKNHRFDLAVLEELKKRQTDCRLLWIGEGELEQELRDLAARKGLQQDIVFQGVVPNVCDYLQAMDVFILPSLFEGLPIVGVEAQAAGLPLLVSDRVSRELALTDSVTFLPIEDPALWVEEILKHRGDRYPDSPTLLAQNGYSIEETARQVRNLYFLAR